MSMGTNISEWDDYFLGNVYEKLTGRNVEIEDDPTVEMADVPILEVVESKTDLIIEYVAYRPQSVTEDSIMISRDKLIDEVEMRDTIRIE